MCFCAINASNPVSNSGSAHHANPHPPLSSLGIGISRPCFGSHAASIAIAAVVVGKVITNLGVFIRCIQSVYPLSSILDDIVMDSLSQPTVITG